jgi:hypothetical protein
MEAWMALPFVKENDVSRHRLESLVTKLSEADLARTTDYGWTVSALLAHLAFWDRRVLALARRWKAKGIDESPIDSDAMNDAVKPLCHSSPHAPPSSFVCLRPERRTPSSRASQPTWSAKSRNHPTTSASIVAFTERIT